jgi:hypothetical protein
MSWHIHLFQALAFGIGAKIWMSSISGTRSVRVHPLVPEDYPKGLLYHCKQAWVLDVEYSYEENDPMEA